jgi:pimeloyl-ACP methyl ester carboxylesterase
MAAYPSFVEAPLEPAGYVVEVRPGDRIHFLDWGGTGEPGVLLIHGLSNTAWSWAPVARRVAAARHAVAMDLRGHGLSDAPTGAYEAADLVADTVAAAEGSGILRPRNTIVLAGHGFGAIVAALTSAELGDRCARLVLVDGGWEDIASTSGMEPDEFLRGLDEPPEVLASLDAFLADRRGYDPATWDADQDRAARATVVETQAGRVVPATRPHALEASVRAMFDYRPAETLARVTAPIVGIQATSPPPGPDLPPIELVRLEAIGHNLMRYRPDDVTAAILRG